MTAGSRWVLVATFVGAAIGYLFPDGAHATVFHASSLQVLSSLFLRLIKCLIAPLVFSTLVVGIAGTAMTSGGSVDSRSARSSTSHSRRPWHSRSASPLPAW